MQNKSEILTFAAKINIKMSKNSEQIAPIKAAAALQNMTLADVAQRIGISYTGFFSQISKNVSEKMYKRIADALNVDVGVLKPRNETDRQTAAPTAKKRLSFPFQCAECGKIHTITIEID